MPSHNVDLDVALVAISDDLDAMVEEVATIAGQQVQLAQDFRDGRQDMRGIDHKLDVLLDLFRTQVFPAIQEIPEIRRRIAYLENRRLSPLDGE